MKTLTLTLVAVACILFAGCMAGERPQFDKTAEYADAGGTEITGPAVNMGHRARFELFSYRKNLRSTADEAGSVGVVSVASETALEKFAASTVSQRGTNQQKSVTYGIGSLKTKAQAEVIKEFMGPLSDVVKAYLTTLGGPVAAIAGNPNLSRDEKNSAILKVLPADAPAEVRAWFEGN
jgi:hypothetical protein